MAQQKISSSLAKKMKQLRKKYSVEFTYSINAESKLLKEVAESVEDYESFIENFFFDKIIASEVIQLPNWKMMPPQFSENKRFSENKITVVYSCYPYKEYGGDQILVEYIIGENNGWGNLESVSLQTANGTLHTTVFGSNGFLKEAIES